MKIEDLDDCVLLLSDNLSAMMDSIGLVMDISALRVSYMHDRLNWDENENQPWYDLELFLERLNDITDVEKYRPIPSDNNMYDPYHAMANFWSVVPWNDRVLEQSNGAFDALVKAIGARLPQGLSHEKSQQQQVAMQETSNSSVSRFSRAFLRRTTKPRFEYIAPGLTVYDTAALPPQIAIHHPN